MASDQVESKFMCSLFADDTNGEFEVFTFKMNLVKISQKIKMI